MRPHNGKGEKGAQRLIDAARLERCTDVIGCTDFNKHLSDSGKFAVWTNVRKEAFLL